MKQCRFCGGKIPGDAQQCEHCGKTLQGSKSDLADAPALTKRDNWENKSIPSWLMYAVVGFFLFCLVFLIIKGCETPADPEGDNAFLQTSATDRAIWSMSNLGLPKTERLWR